MEKCNQPIYKEMRSLAPYFLTISGIYLAVTIVLFFVLGFDYSIPLGGLYGIILTVLNFWLLGKTAQTSIKKRGTKSAKTYMSSMYALRYLGLFLMLTLGALAPFINLIPLFFTRISITIRTLKEKEE